MTRKPASKRPGVFIDLLAEGDRAVSAFQLGSWLVLLCSMEGDERSDVVKMTLEPWRDRYSQGSRALRARMRNVLEALPTTCVDQSIDTPTLRSIPIGRLTGEHAAALASERTGTGLPDGFTWALPKNVPSALLNQKSLLLLRVAMAYDALVSSGSRTPIQGVAQMTALHPTRLQTLVEEARAEGWLTKSTQGRATGRLTKQSKDTLRLLQKLSEQE